MLSVSWAHRFMRAAPRWEAGGHAPLISQTRKWRLWKVKELLPGLQPVTGAAQIPPDTSAHTHGPRQVASQVSRDGGGIVWDPKDSLSSMGTSFFPSHTMVFPAAHPLGLLPTMTDAGSTRFASFDGRPCSCLLYTSDAADECVNV